MHRYRQQQVEGRGARSVRVAFSRAEAAAPVPDDASIAALTANPVLQALFEATGLSLVVLKRERQIVVGDSELIEALGIRDASPAGALRQAESFGCIHACGKTAGCGTSPECSGCGAVLAISEAERSGRPSSRECLMTVRRGEKLDAYELQVTASRIEVDGETYTIVGLRDVSAEKRRDALERVFLHDLSNTLGALLMQSVVLPSRPAEAVPGAARRIQFLAERMQREIEDQRVLMQAEQGTLPIHRAPVQPARVLRIAAGVLQQHPAANDRTLTVEESGSMPPLVTDESILVRVLVNMMKNALEATPPAGVVKAWPQLVPGGCEFRVWNQAVIEPGVALQIFKRSFSTKAGRGRGLGTFSIKLLGERYLGGSVGFTSTHAEGTTFTVRLPL